MLPSQLGHYRLLEKLGEGGMGVVYKAIDTHLDRPVALKILPQDKVADSERKRRFVQEAKAASALNHPNIVTIHDIGADQGVDFLVMEFIEGKTLDQLIPRQGMRLPEMLRIAAQIAEGLTAAHGAGITHRDLKPSNIMVSNAGHVKILDFGLAKLTDRVEVSEHDRTLTEPPHTTEGVILGTICYMSPEQAEGKKVDARSDIFSFGAVLYEMASGQRAFRGDTPASTLGAVIHKDPKPLTELAPVVPHDLDKLVARCLRKDRDRRFQGMADLRVALLDLKEESDTGRLTATATAASPSRSTWQVAAAGAGALILGAAATLFWINRSHSAAVASEPVLTQITRDAGMTSDPALSPDGKLLAYSSDRADGRNMDIWVQQMAGGQPVRLTRHTAVDTNPQFSADGTTIYFYSPRAEGTVWAIPALGGDERVLSKEKAARAFVLSPDGRWIAQGRPSGAGEASPAFLLATASGVARKVETTVQTFIPVTWSTDSSMLIGWGKDDVISLATSSEYRLYAVPAEGGKAIPLEGKMGTTSPSAVRLQGNRLFAVINSAIEEFSVSPGWKIEGPVRRWASFPGAGLAFTASGGAMVAATVTSSTDIWSVPIDANRGKVKGLPERVTNDDASETAPSLSADGSKLVFTSNRHGNRDVWLREMATGKETQVTATADTERRARISPDGSSIAYEVRSKPPAIFMRELGGGEPKPACADCSLPGWSPDSGRVVYFQGKPIQFHTFDVATGQRTVLVAHPTASVQTANLSPDGRWVSFHIPGGGSRNQIWIAPVREGTAAPRAEWIAITENDARYHHAWWSPGGSLLYFLGDSYSRVFARELDPSSKRPRGEPFAVFEPGPGLRLSHPEAVGLSLTRDRLVLTMVQSKSNLWKIE